MGSYQFLAEKAVADIAFVATGKTLEDLFSTAADAVVNVMVEDLETVRPVESRPISLQNTELDMLLFDFLQEIVYFKDAELMILRMPQVRIEERDGGFFLEAVGRGEHLDPDRHRTRADVKAVTLHHFGVKRIDDGWEAQAVLDI